MSTKTEEIQEKRGLTVKVLILGIILSLILAWSFGGQQDYGGGEARMAVVNLTGAKYSFSDSWTPFAAVGGSIALIAIISLINRAKPVFTKQELTVLHIIILLAACSGVPITGQTDYDPYHYPWVWIFLDEDTQATYMDVMGGTMWTPTEFTDYDYAYNVAHGCLARGDAVPVNLGPWAPLLGYMTLQHIGYALLAIVVVFIFRKIYIDIDVVEFPWGEINTVALDRTEGLFGGVKSSVEGLKSSATSTVSNKWFILGVILGLFYILMYLPNNLSWLFTGSTYYTWWMGPTWPDPEARTGGLFTWGSSPLYEYEMLKYGISFLPWISVTFYMMPWVYGMYYLIPMDILIGAAVGLVVFGIMVPVYEFNRGTIPTSWTGNHTKTAFRTVWNRNPHLLLIPFGMSLAFVAIPLWRNRKRLGQMFKTLAGTKIDPSVDNKPPIRYSYVMWLLIITIVILVVSWSFAPLEWAIIPLFLHGITSTVGQTYLMSTGANIGSQTISGDDNDNLLMPTGNGIWRNLLESWMSEQSITRWPDKGPEWLIKAGGPNVAAIHFGMTTYGFTSGPQSQMWQLLITGAIALAAFYMAKRRNLLSSDVVKTLLIFAPLTIIMSNVYRVAKIYWIDVTSGDYETIGNLRWVATFFLNAGEAEVRNYDAATHSMFAVIGFVAIIAVYALRAKFPQIVRFHPAGLWLAIFFPSTLFAVVFAAILKYLTVKIGGADTYNNVGKPIAVGAIVGWGLCWFVHHSFQWLWISRSAFGLWLPPGY
jgi:hypothetical protein